MPSRYLGIDVGTKRIGVASGDSDTKIAFPLKTLTVDGTEVTRLKALSEDMMAEQIIVGYPRSQDGGASAQTSFTEAFVTKLREAGLVCEFQDESVTSLMAEDNLKATGRPYDKADIDAAAAAIILTDFLESLRHG